MFYSSLELIVDWDKLYGGNIQNSHNLQGEKAESKIAIAQHSLSLLVNKIEKEKINVFDFGAACFELWE
jgi:hypothetical protein